MAERENTTTGDGGPKLQAGSTVRIYRDGTELVGPILRVPTGRSNMEIRNLAPGSYVARDEQGGEEAFTVNPKDEAAIVHVGGALEGGGSVAAAGPGAAAIDAVPGPEPESEPTYPATAPSEQPDDAAADRPVLGEPGSALIEPFGEPNAINTPEGVAEFGDEDASVVGPPPQVELVNGQPVSELDDDAPEQSDKLVVKDRDGEDVEVEPGTALETPAGPPIDPATVAADPAGSEPVDGQQDPAAPGDAPAEVRGDDAPEPELEAPEPTEDDEPAPTSVDEPVKADDDAPVEAPSAEPEGPK
jgi:hypothetical protein